jgi:hypothetical protein
MSDKFDKGKLRYDLVPTRTIRRLAEVLTYGAEKYEPNGWQHIDEPVSRYTAAAMRHFEAWRSGEYSDPESELPHLAHCLANIAFLLEFEENRND